MDAPDLAAHDSMTARIAHRAEIEGRVAAFVADHDLAELTKLLDEAGVAHGPVNTAADICADPHMRARGSVVEVRDPRDGRTRLVQGSAGRFSGFEQTIDRGAPRLGEHTRSVLRDLGLAPSTVDALADRGVI
jgi:formyl-CoA transferase